MWEPRQRKVPLCLLSGNDSHLCSVNDLETGTLGWWQKPRRQLDEPVSLPVGMKPTKECKSVRTLRG